MHENIDQGEGDIGTTVTDSEFTRHVSDQLGQKFGRRKRWLFSRISLRKTPRGRFEVYRVIDAGSDKTFALKAHDDPQRNQQEFDSLSSLRRQTPDCVEPLFLAEDRSFLVLEWIDAPVLRASLHGPDRAAKLRRAGLWLKALHQTTKRISNDGRNFPWLKFPTTSGDVLLDTATTHLRNRAASIEKKPAVHAMLHGDYHPGNLFDMDDRLIAFDREVDHVGLVYKDVAFFPLSIEMQRALADIGGEPWSDTAEADRLSFFRGYGPLEYNDLPLLDFSEDLILFRRWRHCRVYFQGSRKAKLLTHKMHERGLIGSESQLAYPGRPVRRKVLPPRWSNTRN